MRITFRDSNIALTNIDSISYSARERFQLQYSSVINISLPARNTFAVEALKLYLRTSDLCEVAGGVVALGSPVGGGA